MLDGNPDPGRVWRCRGRRLVASGDRLLPPMRRLIDQPFWLDPGDPHRGPAAMQVLTQPHNLGWWAILKEHQRLFHVSGRSGFHSIEPPIFETAVHRMVTDGISFEQAAREAIARIKEILAE